MSDMLAMAAIQIGNPILFVILVKSDYWLIHVIEQERKSVERIGKREEIYTEWNNWSVVVRTKRKDPQEGGEITA